MEPAAAMSLRKLWSTFVLPMLMCSALLAPPAARAETEYSLADGLSQNSVLSMVRDDDGFLWLGTEDGLNRFDGYEFRVFRPDSQHALAAGANYIRALPAATCSWPAMAVACRYSIVRRNVSVCWA